jgi:coenzyme Q-binding protein COQ10
MSAARLSGSQGREVARTGSRPWLDDDGRDGDEWELEAELQVGAMGFQESYVSKVRAKKFQLVSVSV